jgi:hypothetical protein
MARDVRGVPHCKMLTEREIPVMVRTACRMKVKPTGLQSLAPRHLALLHYINQRKSAKEAAQKAREMGIL